MIEKRALQSQALLTTHLGNWGIYAAAAGATLAMSTNADAVVVYTAVDQAVSIPTTPATSGAHSAQKSFLMTVGSHKGAENISLRRYSASGGLHSIGFARVFGQFALATSGTSGGGHAAKNFALDAPIGGPFSGGGGTFLENRTAGGVMKGAFGGVQTGFVGFKTGPGLDNYGWIEVSVSDAGSPGYTNELEVIAYAYNTVAGAPIDAGQGIPASGTPEPNTAALGLLASGAVGLALWRRRRKEVA